MVHKILLAAALLFPGAAAVDPAGNVQSWALGWYNHSALVEPNVVRTGGAGVGAMGAPGEHVILTVDLSTVDTSRVDITAPCPKDGQAITCDLTMDDAGMRQVYLSLQPLNTRTGPAGYLTVRAEPFAGTDPDQSDNVSRVDIDLRIDAVTHFGVRAADVQGAVGDTVTVPVTFTNPGPNTLKGISLTHPNGGGGKDFAGGDGCVLTPTPLCQVARIPPGTSKTVNLKFHIRRCFQPVPGDPDYGAPLNGGVPVDTGTVLYTVDPKTSDQTFRIRVRDCAQNFPGPAQTMGAASASAAPSAPAPPAGVPPEGGLELVPEPPQPSTARTDMSRPAGSGLAVLLLIGAGAVALVRLRRRRKGL